MKKRYSLLVVLFVVGVGMTSCDKWLEVDPKFDVYEESLFEEAQGYFAALNGLYVNLSERALYGQELSWGAAEAWGGGYALQKNNNAQGYIDLSQYDYQTVDAKKIGANIWLGCFNTIAESNNLIQNLESDHTTAFPYGDVTRNMILGEAYAVRAMMHFELVRVFAKSLVTDNGGVSSYVPFVDQFPSKVNAPIPTKEVLARVISDLEKARDLIAPFDTLPENPGYISFSSTLAGVRVKLDDGVGVSMADDEFFRYRGNRLNYYPILQLLARVCLYAGNDDKAFAYANQIVSLVNKKKPYNFVKPASIGDPMNLSTVEPRLHSEIVFGAYNSNLKGWVENAFNPSSSQRLRVANKSVLFAENSSDCRLKAIPSDMCTKYSARGKVEKQMTAAQSLVPVLRFPECFYIAAESVYKKDKNQAIEIFNSLVTARNNAKYKIDVNISDRDFIKAIVKEYRREFLSEGAMIFVYKRLNLSFKNETLEDNQNDLVMPIPDSEAGIQ